MGGGVSRQARLFNIPPGARFLPTLVDAILDDQLGLGLSPDDPLGLARATLYLPTRRAAQALQASLAAALARRTGRSATLLPRIRPLGQLEEAEVSLAGGYGNGELGDPFGPDPSPPLPPAITPLRRQLLLAHQIEAWGRVVNRACFDLDAATARLVPDGLGEAVALAAHLADLIDTMHASSVGFDALKQLDAARFDQLWEFTHRFLAIAGETWPTLLAAEGALDPADRRNRLIAAECARIGAGHLTGPVIAAGSTGSVPATAKLLAAIAASPRGAVILPGLDMHLEDSAWDSLAQAPDRDRQDEAISHPQTVMARLVAGMGIPRSEIVSLGAETAAGAARARLASEALRPADTTHRWRAHPFGEAEATTALTGVAIVEAADERAEAAIIALGLREALEDPAARVALVTPDRGLAQRVAIELARWGVAVDDSAGLSLARTLPGDLALLALDVLDPAADTTTLCALVHHALLRGGAVGLADGNARARAASALEIALLRGGLNAPGLQGLLASLPHMAARRDEHHAPPPLKRLKDTDLAAAATLAQHLAASLAPLRACVAASTVEMPRWAKAHREALAALTAGTDMAPAAFDGETGARLAALLEALEEEAHSQPACAFRDYCDVARTLIRQEIIAPHMRGPARVTILGLLEARLIDHDLVVLGGLNEGIWPGEAGPDPFLNRPMRQELGLPLPERRVGQSAHDFTQAFAGAPRTILTRALKAALTQTVPSRFWQRLGTVTPQTAWQAALARGARLAGIAQALAQPALSQACERPAPVVPARLQPARFSVTEIETMARDPYAIYAKRILRLAPLEPLMPELGARERGQLLHDILARFAATWPQGLPANPQARLMTLAEEAFAPLMGEPEVAAFWWPRFSAIAEAFIAWERERRPLIAHVAAEIDGRMPLTLPGGDVITLTARADRIEAWRDGTLALIDFKSGRMPTNGEIEAGFSLQLTLQAAMAEAGAFTGQAARACTSALYMPLKPEDGQLKPVGKSGDELAALVRTHLEEWRVALAAYRAGARGFVSRLAPRKEREAGDYDALARVKEWSRGGEDEAEGEA